MTSKERLLTVLKHGQPDRVPVSTYDMTGWSYDPRQLSGDAKLLRELFFTYMTGWWNHEPSYRPLMEKIRKKADCIFMTDVICTNSYAAQHTRVEQRTEGKSTFTRITLTTPKGDLTQEFRVDQGVYTAWQTEHRIKDESDIEKYLSIPFFPEEPDVSHLKKQEEYLGDNGILLIDIPDPVNEVFSQFDFADFMTLAFTDEAIVKRMLDKAYEEQTYFLEKMLKKGAGPLFRFAEPEVCTPPYMPHDLFEKYVTFYDKKLIRLIHDHGQYARIHSHGKIKTVIRDFLEMEVDAIDPVEAPDSGDLTLKEAKALCGNSICLMGNLQLKDLEFLPAAEMRETVKQCVLDGKPGGNFVLLPTATPLNVPLSKRTEENFEIMLDTALEYGAY